MVWLPCRQHEYGSSSDRPICPSTLAAPPTRHVPFPHIAADSYTMHRIGNRDLLDEPVNVCIIAATNCHSHLQSVGLIHRTCHLQNVFVGGENKWAYSTFTNWEFWWPGFPVIAYFKVRVAAECLCCCGHQTRPAECDVVR